MKKPYLFGTKPDYVRVTALQTDAPLGAELERAIACGIVAMNSQLRYRDEHADGATRSLGIVCPEGPTTA